MHAGYLAEYAASSFLTHEIIVQCFTADKYCKILPVVLRTVVCTVPVHVLYIGTVLYYAVSCNEEKEMFQKCQCIGTTGIFTQSFLWKLFQKLAYPVRSDIKTFN